MPIHANCSQQSRGRESARRRKSTDRGFYFVRGFVLFQVGTEFVTPTEGWLDVPIDGAVTVPTVCPELPIIPCCTGAPVRPLVLPGVPVADVCALTASGAAANPTAISAAMERFVLVMADPFGRGLSIAMPFLEAPVH
jgi:hypothetical protein